jgi:hypothetical protein
VVEIGASDVNSFGLPSSNKHKGGLNMKWIKGKKVLTAAMLALVTASVVGCYVPYRHYSYYDHHRRDDYRRRDHHDRDRGHHRWDYDHWRYDRDRW